MTTEQNHIRPLQGHEILPEEMMSPWQDGCSKPAVDGEYLRDFEEGEAVSEFNSGQWLRDGLFPSDIQDARWRGLPAN